ncbi:MAG: VWA domain-containing protein [bacterium]
MLRFEHIQLLWALLAIPVFSLLYAFLRVKRTNNLRKFGDLDLVARLHPDTSRFKSLSKFILLCMAFTLLVIGAANPQIGNKLEKVDREGIEIMVVLDISNSMNAQDIKPSRLERAKQAITKLIDKLLSDKIGSVVFAGDSFILLPITTDFSAAKMLISSAESDLIDRQGTALGSAIDLASGSNSPNKSQSKLMIIISDGENHEDDAIASAKSAAEKGIIIYTIGMGKPTGAPVPKLGKDGNVIGYEKDESGNTVISKLNGPALKEIADIGDGEFVYASSGTLDLNTIIDKISKMKKNKYGSKIFTDFDDKFQYFLLAAFLLLVIELIITHRKNRYLSALSDFAGGKKKNEK